MGNIRRESGIKQGPDGFFLSRLGASPRAGNARNGSVCRCYCGDASDSGLPAAYSRCISVSDRPDDTLRSGCIFPAVFLGCPVVFFGCLEESGGKLLVYQPERHCENGCGHADFNEFGSSFYGSVGAGHPSGDIPDSINHRHGPVDLSVPDENR